MCSWLRQHVNSLMSSHAGLPTKKVWCVDSNSYSQEGMSSKTAMDHWIIQFSVSHYSLYTLVGHLIFQLENILMTVTLNQTTRSQTLWRSIHLETDIITCIPISQQYLQESHSHVVKMYGNSKQSSRSGFDHFLQTKHPPKNFEYT